MWYKIVPIEIGSDRVRVYSKKDIGRNYCIIPTVRNLIDPNPTIFTANVVDQSYEEFTVQLSGCIDKYNYELVCLIMA